MPSVTITNGNRYLSANELDLLAECEAIRAGDIAVVLESGQRLKQRVLYVVAVFASEFAKVDDDEFVLLLIRLAITLREVARRRLDL